MLRKEDDLRLGLGADGEGAGCCATVAFTERSGRANVSSSSLSATSQSSSLLGIASVEYIQQEEQESDKIVCKDDDGGWRQDTRAIRRRRHPDARLPVAYASVT